MIKTLLKTFFWRTGFIFVIFLLNFGYSLKQANSFTRESEARIEKVHQDLLKVGMPFSQAIEVTTAMKISAVENAAFVGQSNITQLYFCVLISMFMFISPAWRRAVSFAMNSEPKAQSEVSLRS